MSNLLLVRPLCLLQVANAVLILVMIPIFNSAIYPALARCNLLKTSLQRIGVGFFCAALAFFVSGFVDLQLEVKLRQFMEPLKLSLLLIVKP